MTHFQKTLLANLIETWNDSYGHTADGGRAVEIAIHALAMSVAEYPVDFGSPGSSYQPPTLEQLTLELREV